MSPSCRTIAVTADFPAAAERRLYVSQPDRLWVADINCITPWAGFLYQAVVLDAFSRRVVGWAMENSLKTELVLAASNMAICQAADRRHPLLRPRDAVHLDCLRQSLPLAGRASFDGLGGLSGAASRTSQPPTGPEPAIRAEGTRVSVRPQSEAAAYWSGCWSAYLS